MITMLKGAGEGVALSILIVHTPPHIPGAHHPAGSLAFSVRSRAVKDAPARAGANKGRNGHAFEASRPRLGGCDCIFRRGHHGARRGRTLRPVLHLSHWAVRRL